MIQSLAVRPKRSKIRKGAQVKVLNSWNPEDIGQTGQVLGKSTNPGELLVSLQGQAVARHFQSDQLQVIKPETPLRLVVSQPQRGVALSSLPAASSLDLCKQILENLLLERDRLLKAGANVSWWISSGTTKGGKIQYYRTYPKSTGKKREYIKADHLAEARATYQLRLQLDQVREAIQHFENGLAALKNVAQVLQPSDRVVEAKEDAIAIQSAPKKRLPPLLKWAGGKTWLVAKLNELYEPYRSTHIWAEPFAGGLGAAMGVIPNHALLNDVNEQVINLYQRVQLGELTSEHICQSNDLESFQRNRALLNERSQQRKLDGTPLDLIDAALFYYLNRTCRSGLCRFSKEGNFNTPWGKYPNPLLTHNFADYQAVFQGWQFSCGDFELLTEAIRRRPTFLYCDPPYDGSNKAFTSYSKGGFGWAEQVRLAEWCAALGVPVVISNAATDRILELYVSLGFTVLLLDAPRSINCTGDRSKAAEVIATKNLEVSA